MIVNGVSVPRPRNYLSVNYYSKHCLIQKIVCKILVIQRSWQTKLSKVKCCQLLQKIEIHSGVHKRISLASPTWVWSRVRPRIQRIWPDLIIYYCKAKAAVIINKRTEIAKIEDRPANHWVVGMMTGVMGVAGIKQIRKEKNCGNCSPWCWIVEMRGERLGRMGSHPEKIDPQCWMNCQAKF